MSIVKIVSSDKSRVTLHYTEGGMRFQLVLKTELNHLLHVIQLAKKDDCMLEIEENVTENAWIPKLYLSPHAITSTIPRSV